MVDVDDGLKYPLRGDNTLELHAVGGGVPVALNVVSSIVGLVGLLVPLLWLLFLPLGLANLAVGVLWTGYFVRVARDTFAGGTEPPALGDWGVVRDGVWGTLVVVAYLIPMVVLSVLGSGLVFVVVFGAGVGVDRGFEAAAATAGVLGVVVMLLLFLVVLGYGLVVAYLLPVSLVAYADEGRVGAAFSLDTLVTVGTDGEYAGAWAVTVGVYLVAGMVVSALTAILVGYMLLPLMPLLYFYLGTAGFHMFARAYADATGTTIPGTGTTDEAVGTAAGNQVGTRAPDDV